MPMMIFTTLFFLGIFIMFVFILFGQEKVIKQVNKELDTIRAQLEVVEKRLATQQQQTLNLPLESPERTKSKPVADTLAQPTHTVQPTHSAQAASAASYNQSQQIPTAQIPTAQIPTAQIPTAQKNTRDYGTDFMDVNFGEAPRLKPQPDSPHFHTSPASNHVSSVAAKEFPSPMTEAYTVHKHKDYPQQSVQFPKANVYQAEHERLAPPHIAQNPLATNANTNGAPQDLELFMAPPKRR